MSAKKLEIDFNGHFPWMWQEAQRQKLKKGEWMTKAGLDPQRWAEFARAAGILPSGPKVVNRSISAYYLNKLAGGLTLSVDQVEKNSGIRFSVEQRLELKKQAWVRANDDIITLMMQNPNFVRLLSYLLLDSQTPQSPGCLCEMGAFAGGLVA